MMVSFRYAPITFCSLQRNTGAWQRPHKFIHCQKHWSIEKALADDVVEAVAALHLVDRVPEMTSNVQIRPCLVPRGVQKAS